MIKRHMKQIAAGLMCAVMLLSMVPVQVARADSGRIVTLGKDVSQEGRTNVLKFFGLTESDLKDLEVITIDNQQEHELLDGIVPKDVIGSKTYSCAYIQPTRSGGLNIKTANLTYVTSRSIYNALQTAGIENGNILVTAPFEVSGTGALTGIFKAYELDGSALSEEKKELAAEELILDSDLEEDYGEESTDLVADLKEAVAAEEGMSQEEITSLVEEKAQEHNVNLSEEDVARLTALLDKLDSMDYDASAFSDKLDDIKNTIADTSTETKGILEQILDFIKGLFGMGSSNTESTGGDSGDSIFNDIDTSVFSLDKE